MDDIYPRSLPTEPLRVIEYEQLSNYKRQKLTQEFYIDNPGVMIYHEERDRIIRGNNTNLLNLKTYKEHIPESDIKGHKKSDKAINDFRLKMEG